MLRPTDQKNSPVSTLAASAALSAVLLAADKMLPGVTIAPLLAVTCIFAGAVFLNPVSLILASLPLTGAVVMALFGPWLALVEPPGGGDVRLAVVRFGSYVVGLAAAVLSSFWRDELRKNLLNLREIMSRLPIGVVFSDVRGRILWMNETARNLSGAGNRADLTWEDLFPGEAEGIDYSALLLDDTACDLASRRLQSIGAQVFSLRQGRKSILVTTLMPDCRKLETESCLSAGCASSGGGPSAT